MNRNALIAIIVILVAGLTVLGWIYWQERQNSGVSLQVNEGGVSIDTY